MKPSALRSSDALALEWDFAAVHLVARGEKAAMAEAFGKLPVLVDLDRRYFVFRAVERRLSPARLSDGRFEACYVGTWVER